MTSHTRSPVSRRHRHSWSATASVYQQVALIICLANFSLTGHCGRGEALTLYVFHHRATLASAKPECLSINSTWESPPPVNTHPPSTHPPIRGTGATSATGLVRHHKVTAADVSILSTWCCRRTCWTCSPEPPRPYELLRAPQPCRLPQQHGTRSHSCRVTHKRAGSP